MKTIILCFLIGLVGCAATEKQTKPTMSQGESLYRANCSLCHRVYSPEQYTFEKLGKYVNKYGRGLTVYQRQGLLQYLKTTSKVQK